MIQVRIKNLDSEKEFGKKGFNSIEEAESWVDSHSGKGKNFEVEYTQQRADIEKEVKHILKNTDWLFISDVPMAKEFRVVFKRYRQHLRDLKVTELNVEPFEKWLRRMYPEHFLEGRDGPNMVKKFNTYLEE